MIGLGPYRFVSQSPSDEFVSKKRKHRKAFFSEEKNQKTFIFWCNP
jgi:hypothetical protein